MKYRNGINWTDSYKNDANPHYFTVDVEETGFKFYMGSHQMVLPGPMVRSLINGNDFYGNVKNLFLIHNDPDAFAQDLVQLLREESRFARVEGTSFEDGVFYGRFSVDLDANGLLLPADAKTRFIYGDRDFAIYVSGYDVNFENIFKQLKFAYGAAVGDSHYKPNLDD